MANEKGLSVLLQVGATAAAPATYSTLEGQTETTLDGTTNVADITDKDAAGWSLGMATTRSGTVVASGNLKTPRPNLELLETAWRTGGTHGCRIILDSAGKAYTGIFSVTSFSITGSTTDAGKYSVTLTPTAALANVTVAP